MQIIDESPAEFPSVLICDSNPFTTLESQFLLDQMMNLITFNKRDYIGYNNTGIGLDKLGFYNYYFPQKELLLSIDLNQFASTLAFEPTFTNLQRKSLGWNLSEVLINCKFNGFDCDISKDFEWYHSFQYGNCYHFNTLKNKVEFFI